MPLVDLPGSGETGAAAYSPRVLIIDDQIVVRGAVRSALDKLDRSFLIIETDNGEEALAIMRAAPVDIIFCDIRLPGISGPEALLHAYGEKALRPFMVLMSAMKDRSVREIGDKIGIYEFMTKPFPAADVRRAVEAYDRLRRVTRVLLVDDSGTARKLMARILDRSRFHIELHEAASGQEALSRAAATAFDVIFCDFNMPGIDGVETAGELLRHHPALQVVLVSTEQQARTIRSAQFVGAFAFLKKPFGAADVDAVLHEAFALRQPTIARPTHAIIADPGTVPERAVPLPPA